MSTDRNDPTAADRMRRYRARLRGDEDAPEPRRPGPKYTIPRLNALIVRRLNELRDEVEPAAHELFPDEVWKGLGEEEPPGYELVRILERAATEALIHLEIQDAGGPAAWLKKQEGLVSSYE